MQKQTQPYFHTILYKSYVAFVGKYIVEKERWKIVPPETWIFLIRLNVGIWKQINLRSSSLTLLGRSQHRSSRFQTIPHSTTIQPFWSGLCPKYWSRKYRKSVLTIAGGYTYDNAGVTYYCWHHELRHFGVSFWHHEFCHFDVINWRHDI